MRRESKLNGDWLCCCGKAPEGWQEGGVLESSGAEERSSSTSSKMLQNAPSRRAERAARRTRVSILCSRHVSATEGFAGALANIRRGVDNIRSRSGSSGCHESSPTSALSAAFASPRQIRAIRWCLRTWRMSAEGHRQMSGGGADQLTRRIPWLLSRNLPSSSRLAGRRIAYS